MTRRIRFTPLLAAGAFLAFASVGPARAGDVPFAPMAAVGPSDGPKSMATGDVDGDGDVDALAGTFGGTALSWYENLAGNGTTWAQRTIATAPFPAAFTGVAAADIDGDGDLDAASITFYGTVAWHRNDAGNGSSWTNTVIATWGTAQSALLGMAAGDVDADGDVDVVSTFADGRVLFHENVTSIGTAWTTRTITPAGLPSMDVSLGDLDGDGDGDAVSTRNNADVVQWHENVVGDGSVWTTRTVATVADGAYRAIAADVDRDGDADLVVSLREGSTLVWYENAGGTGATWVPHTIASGSAPLRMFASDLDGDGDLDVLSSWVDRVTWHENATGNGGAWVLRTLATLGAVPVDVADVDRDGDPDLMAGFFQLAAAIQWFRNESIHETACFGPVRTIFQTNQPFGAAAADVDRDGDLDVFATSFGAGSDITWHRNTGAAAAWTAFTVATSHGPFVANPADIDGDGDADALLGADFAHPVSWAKNLGNGSAWSVLPIGTPGAPPFSDVKGVDIDGDGDLDALASSGGTNPVAWFENQTGEGDSWLLRTIATTANGGLTLPVDLDRDGDLDVLAGDDPLVWHENVTGDGATWTRRTIAAIAGDIVTSLDLDADGDLDVLASNLTSLPGLRWYENLAGNGTSWATHTLATLPLLAQLEPRDVDADGDLDILVSAEIDQLVWLERTGPGVTFAPHTLSNVAGGVGQLTGPDLDGDGAPDILWASQLGDSVRWNRNGRGQVVLDLLDQVPTTVNNNDVFPILRLTVTHGGRVGDSDLELARLGLLFEEEPGDALTSAEANALVEELRIYRDTNGNGTFDPGIDALVATVPTLALSAGVQAVPFADADPNVQVAFGTPRTFFVVAQLTANASQQAPHQFRLTHLALGPSATQAEDRSADIPLTIACPADFASRLIVATPVELMGFTVE